jgi:hypothetical protein
MLNNGMDPSIVNADEASIVEHMTAIGCGSRAYPRMFGNCCCRGGVELQDESMMR